MIERVTRPQKNIQRPCKHCKWFRWLDAGKRFGVCDKHEMPSYPRECVVYKPKGIKKI